MLNTKSVRKIVHHNVVVLKNAKKVSKEAKTYDIEPSLQWSNSSNLNVGYHLEDLAFPEKCIKQFPNFIGKMLS